jgi:hypothetical protein
VSESEYEQWFMRTFEERENALDEWFGKSHPPGCPQGHVVSFHICGSGNHQTLIPGACAHVCPPRVRGHEPRPITRGDWLYVSVGLSQPAGPEDQPWDNSDRGCRLSGHGVEFAICVPEASNWPASFLAELLGYAARQSPVYQGHRIPFGLYQAASEQTQWFVGFDKDLGIKPVGPIRALLFWPLLCAPRWFTTSTGNFELLCATTITQSEWEYARQTSSAHLLLLLCEAGIGQTSFTQRECTFTQGPWRRRAAEIRSLNHDAVLAAIRRQPDSF